LLVAHPAMRDPNFRRTILLLSMYDTENGAFGLVINRPTNKKLSDYVTDAKRELLEDVPVYIGGPVGSNELTIVSFRWEATEGQITIQSHLSLDQVEEVKAANPGTLRAFRGYAGWSAGQLESELQQSAWLIHPPTKEVWDAADDEQAWYRLVSSLGPAYRLLALAPDDPSLN
jgi:putative transcriptional regulator